MRQMICAVLAPRACALARPPAQRHLAACAATTRGGIESATSGRKLILIHSQASGIPSAIFEPLNCRPGSALWSLLGLPSSWPSCFEFPRAAGVFRPVFFAPISVVEIQMQCFCPAQQAAERLRRRLLLLCWSVVGRVGEGTFRSAVVSGSSGEWAHRRRQATGVRRRPHLWCRTCR